ncbi:MAG: sensor histidine kinase [Muricoprocola sp.]
MKTTEKYELLISSISHEIRNPVTLISSYLQLIEDNHPEVDTFEHWNTVTEEMKYLRLLLSDISCFNNGMHLHTVPVDFQKWLPDYFTRADLYVRELAKQYHLPLEFETDSLPSDLPTLPADPVKLRQVLDNLLRNATEAHLSSKKQLPYVHLSAFLSKRHLEISIEDNGCGIMPEDQKTIFQPFTTHKPSGTGLGLSIASRIIKAHHGNLTFHSEPDQGSVFTVSLPIPGVQNLSTARVSEEEPLPG